MSTKREVEILLFMDVSNERFALNATSILDQTNASIRDDFVESQNNLDLLSYQKNPRLMQYTLRKKFGALKSISPKLIKLMKVST